MTCQRIAVVIAVALVLGACGGGSGTADIATLETSGTSSTDTTAAVEEVSMEDGLIAFSECLREQGVEVGDPVVGPDGGLQMPPIEISGEGGSEADMDEMMRGMDAVFGECEPLLGDVAFTNENLPDFNEFEDLLLEYAACMRDNGVDMPDPDFSGTGGIIDLGIGDPADPAFITADEACRPILAGALSGG